MSCFDVRQFSSEVESILAGLQKQVIEQKLGTLRVRCRAVSGRSLKCTFVVCYVCVCAASSKEESKRLRIPKSFDDDLRKLERYTTTSLPEPNRKHMYTRIASILPFGVVSIKVRSD